MKLTNDELDAILAKGGLRINQPYNSRGSYQKDEYIFTTCTDCGVEAHYRLKYILDKNAQEERVCRACHWLSWYGVAHELYDGSVQTMIERGATRRELIEQGVISQEKGLGWKKASELAEKHGFELVDLITGAQESDEVMIVRCRSCGKQTAERPGDVAFGCGCSKRGGIQYGQEAKKPATPIDKREVAPRTPGAASINSLIERHRANPSTYSYFDLEGKPSQISPNSSPHGTRTFRRRASPSPDGGSPISFVPTGIIRTSPLTAISTTVAWSAGDLRRKQPRTSNTCVRRIPSLQRNGFTR
ncbi:hypothetical protein [Cryptobacterium curtum]|uniref:hypothetical protein n=1 Tax=Cryptobacterium curtum TaxID=84163 RepID=UPI00248EE8FB|nr:hypothetical protein [Cryptobacterium curtum]